MDIENFILENWLMILFGAIIVLFIVVDLGFAQRKVEKIRFRSAALQSIFWVSISLGFGALIIINKGGEKGAQFFSAYLMEWSLSVDNIFVFLLILTYFNIEDKYYHKVLFYGILGAIIFRGIFISIGIVLINEFEWILYIFGGILIFTGLKMLFMKKDDKFNPEKNLVYRFLNKRFRFTDDDDTGTFYKRIDNKIYLTPMFLVLALIETSDIIFALDSIPAVFAITQDSFIVYSSNIFAVMGLRAMFILISGVIDKFKYLQQGISFILVFIGVKMLMEMDFIGYHLPTKISLCIILLMIGSSILLSVIKPGKK